MEIRAGFEPAINSFADCPLKPLEYRIMLVIRAGLEPSISALKGLRPDHLDEWIIWGARSPDQATVVTKISSMRTLSNAARTIRLSTVGRAVPFCHL